MRKFANKGFTIVELVIVIAVIAILAAVLIPTFSGIISRANESGVMQQAANTYKNYLFNAKSNPNNVVRDGFVFIQDNYAFANIEGEMQKLELLGKKTISAKNANAVGTFILPGIFKSTDSHVTADALYEIKFETEYSIYSITASGEVYYLWVGENMDVTEYFIDTSGSSKMKVYSAGMVKAEGEYKPWDETDSNLISKYLWEIRLQGVGEAKLSFDFSGVVSLKVSKTDLDIMTFIPNSQTDDAVSETADIAELPVSWFNSVKKSSGNILYITNV